jgi:hypothetical protein
MTDARFKGMKVVASLAGHKHHVIVLSVAFSPVIGRAEHKSLPAQQAQAQQVAGTASTPTPTEGKERKTNRDHFFATRRKKRRGTDDIMSYITNLRLFCLNFERVFFLFKTS